MISFSAPGKSRLLLLACAAWLLVSAPAWADFSLALAERDWERLARLLEAGAPGVPALSRIEAARALLEIDEGGLNQTDRDILTLLVEKFGGGPVGLKTIAASLSEEEATIEEVNEPYLMQLGFLERTPRGRTVTKKGYEHIGADVPKNQSHLL